VVTAAPRITSTRGNVAPCSLSRVVPLPKYLRAAAVVKEATKRGRGAGTTRGDKQGTAGVFLAEDDHRPCQGQWWATVTRDDGALAEELLASCRRPCFGHRWVAPGADPPERYEDGLDHDGVRSGDEAAPGAPWRHRRVCDVR